MNGATHIAMTKAVVEALGWKGDHNLVAQNADYPDRVRAIEVEKYGAYVIGRNLASLTHFVQPVGKDKYVGYCWKRDRSVPHIDLSSVKVIPKPEAWGWPFDASMTAKEPLAVLVRTLTQPSSKGSIQADEITYSTAAIMGEWAENCYGELAKKLTGAERQKALDTVAGSIFHLGAQDPAVPHHADCILLDGHSGFEGDVDEEYKRMVGDGTIGELLKTMIKADNAPAGLTIRAIAEQTATRAVVSPRKLGFYQCFWRRGWNKLVHRCVLLGLTSSVQVCKVLMREGA
jgi:hypothetical protein